MVHSQFSLPKSIGLTLLCGSLAACSSSSNSDPEPISSNIAPLVNNRADTTMLPGSTLSETITSGNATVAYAVGATGTPGNITGVTASAGFEPGTQLGAAPQTSGSASYTGNYGVALLDNVELNPGNESWSEREFSGTLTVNADFGAGTLTGSVDQTAQGLPAHLVHTLTVNGTLDGGTIDGSVDLTYINEGTPASINGDLEGAIGTDAALGVFHAHDANTVMSGGFAAVSPP